jgi:hypothetical protein
VSYKGFSEMGGFFFADCSGFVAVLETDTTHGSNYDPARRDIRTLSVQTSMPRVVQYASTGSSLIPNYLPKY